MDSCKPVKDYEGLGLFMACGELMLVSIEEAVLQAAREFLPLEGIIGISIQM